MRKGVEPNRRCVGFKSVIVVDAIIAVDANFVDPTDISKVCAVVEEYSTSTRLFVLDVVAAGLLMLLVDEMKVVMRKGVEANNNVAGFKSVVVVNEMISVDGMEEYNEDKR